MKTKVFSLFLRGNNDVPLLHLMAPEKSTLERYAKSVLGLDNGYKIEEAEVGKFTNEGVWTTNRAAREK